MINTVTRVTTATGTFGLLFLFATPRAAKMIAIYANKCSHGFTLWMPACYVIFSDCHSCVGEGIREWACRVCVCVCTSSVCSRAAGHINSSSCVRGWRAPLSSQSSSCLRKLFPAADSFGRPAASVSGLTWRCVQISLFWVFQEFLGMKRAHSWVYGFCKIRCLPM